MSAQRYTGEDRKELDRLRRRVNRARRFPSNTDPCSRHLHLMAEALCSKRGVYHMLDEEPDHCAETMLVVLHALWTLRNKSPEYKREVERAIARATASAPIEDGARGEG